jgi:two-component system, OmpR family, sensor kinase
VSLRLRLVLSSAYILTVVVIALVVPLAVNIDRRATSEFEQVVLGNTSILAARVSDLVADSRGAAQPAPPALVDAAEGTAAETGARVVVVNRNGKVLHDSDGTASPGDLYATEERPEFSAALFEGRIDSRNRVSDTLNQELVLVTVPVVDEGRVVGAVRASEDMGSVDAGVRRSQLALGLLGLAVIAAGLALAWILASSVARPVRRLEEAAGRLGAGDPQARAEPEGPAEIATLASSFNRMAGTLSANLVAQRDFLANASHQLRTPLTGLKLRLEAIREEGGFAGQQAAKAEAEVDRLTELVDDLLQLARASSVDSTGAPVDLGDAVRKSAERWTAPARDRDHVIEAHSDGGMIVWADATDVAHVLDNLVENAIHYCPPGSRIEIAAAQRDGRASVTVSDNGPGIAPDELDRVFERFYRGSSGRRSGPGTGLGLAIASELARRWGGDVRILSGPGTRIEASFLPPPTVS